MTKQLTKHYYFIVSAMSIEQLNAVLESQEGIHFTNTEELLADESITQEVLTEWYNLDNPNPVESFESREVAAEAVIDMLLANEAEQAKPQGQVVSTDGKPTGQAAPTKKEQAAAAKAKKEEEKKAAAEAKAKAKEEAAAAKAKAKEEAAKAKAEKAANKAAPKAAGAPRAGNLSNKILFHTIKPTTVEGVETIVNPRRAGTFGHVSLGLIIAAGDEGIKYADFIKAGGRSKDFRWDQEHNYADEKDDPEAAKAPATGEPAEGTATDAGEANSTSPVTEVAETGENQ